MNQSPRHRGRTLHRHITSHRHHRLVPDPTVIASIGTVFEDCLPFTMSPREVVPAPDSSVLGDRVPSESSLTSLDQSTTSRSSSTKGVAFGSVTVREYERIVGDHPGKQSLLLAK